MPTFCVGTTDRVGGDIDARVAAVGAALSPYPWRALTADMLARWVVGAVDGHDVDALLVRIPGVAVPPGGEPVQTADADDIRVPWLVRFLSSRPWRSMTLSAVVADSVAALDELEHSWALLQAELDLLGGG
jgi:hypothetical protein